MFCRLAASCLEQINSASAIAALLPTLPPPPPSSAASAPSTLPSLSSVVHHHSSLLLSSPSASPAARRGAVFLLARLLPLICRRTDAPSLPQTHTTSLPLVHPVGCAPSQPAAHADQRSDSPSVLMQAAVDALCKAAIDNVRGRPRREREREKGKGGGKGKEGGAFKERGQPGPCIGWTCERSSE